MVDIDDREKLLEKAVTDGVDCLNVPADVKQRIAKAIKAEMEKRWECDDDVIDSFGYVAAVAWSLAKADK